MVSVPLNGFSKKQKLFTLLKCSKVNNFEYHKMNFLTSFADSTSKMFLCVMTQSYSWQVSDILSGNYLPLRSLATHDCFLFWSFPLLNTFIPYHQTNYCNNTFFAWPAFSRIHPYSIVSLHGASIL